MQTNKMAFVLFGLNNKEKRMDDMVGQLADLSGYFESFFSKAEGKTSSKA